MKKGNKMGAEVKVLTSENIVYTPITVEDTDMVLKWRNCEAVKSNFIYTADVTREDHLNWLKNKVDTGKVIQFVMSEKKSGNAFGSVYLKDVNYTARKAEFGIFIGEDDFRGLKYGTEAAAKMIDYCLNDMGFHKLYLRVLDRNEAAKKAYEKAGFGVEGRLVDEEFINGQFETIIMMAALEDK